MQKRDTAMTQNERLATGSQSALAYELGSNRLALETACYSTEFRPWPKKGRNQHLLAPNKHPLELSDIGMGRLGCTKIALEIIQRVRGT